MATTPMRISYLDFFTIPQNFVIHDYNYYLSFNDFEFTEVNFNYKITNYSDTFLTRQHNDYKT